MQRYTFLIALQILLFEFVSAQDSGTELDNEPIKIQRIKSKVEIDGLSNEAAWESINPMPMFMRIPNYGHHEPIMLYGKQLRLL